MCGIAGEIRFGPRTHETNWEAISAKMKNRGPDDSGLWEDKLCTLVFRRLAILDLSPNGHQPMVSIDGRYVLVFNGEVYNFREIRDVLEQKGYKFRSNSDSEVVLNALIEWNQEALDKFNGMFALGFYDTFDNKLLIARDHAGIKPLYYMRNSNGIMFASQYDQIMAHPWSKNLPYSMDAMSLYLRLAHIPAPYAALENTFMLEAGHWLEISSDGKVNTGRHFVLPQFERPTLFGEQAYEAVDAAVSSAVKRQLVSDVPLGAFLSGGIDSPLVVAKMCEKSTKGVHTFTIGTAGDATDESDDASLYARELGVNHTLKQMDGTQALDMLDDVMAACGEPFGDYSIFPTMLVSKLAAENYKVMLSGDGGDELFWGYGKRFATVIDVAEQFGRPHWLRKGLWGAKKITGLGNMSYDLRRHATVGEFFRSKHNHIPDSILPGVFPSLNDWPEEYSQYDFNGHNKDETAQWLRWNEFVSHLTMVLQKVDRASMHFSLEVRVPLLDKEVIAVAQKINWQSCLDQKRRYGKIPLRKSLSRHIKHQTEAKRGFAVPMSSWLRTSLRPVVEDLVCSRKELAGIELGSEALSGLFRQHVDNERDLSWWLWPLLNLALWEEKYRKS